MDASLNAKRKNSLQPIAKPLKSFLVFYREKPVADITNEDVIIYNNEHILKTSFRHLIKSNCQCHKAVFITVREIKINIDKIHRPNGQSFTHV
jgi:integrase/recombinase XerD